VRVGIATSARLRATTKTAGFPSQQKGRRVKQKYSLLAILLIAACSELTANLDDATAAAGEELDTYSRGITRPAQLGRDASLVQRFCVNMTKAVCAPDTAEKLKAYGFADNQTRVDLAYAFTMIAADAKDGTADQASSVEDFLSGAYLVILGREPDQDGASNHRKHINDAGDRKTVLRTMLQSAEFKALK
jgi:hypothetical protein